MSAYTDFLDLVMPHVPGASTAIATHEVKMTVIDFCKRSMAYQRDHDPVTVIRNMIDYDLDPPTGTLVIKVMKAWYKDNELNPVSPEYITNPTFYNSSFAGANVVLSTPNVYTQKDERTVSIFPFPDTTVSMGLTMRVALKPTMASTTVDNFILEDHGETIMHGTLQRLFASPGKPYSNPNLATAHGAMFMEGVNTARQNATRGHVRSNMQVKLRRI